MKNKIATLLYLKNKTIYLRLTVNGERAVISTTWKVKPSEWNPVTQRVKDKSDLSMTTNLALISILDKVNKVFLTIDNKGDTVSVKAIIEELRGTTCNMTLLKAYQFHIDNITKLNGISFADATVKKYGYSLNTLKTYLAGKDPRLSELNYKFIEDYHTYLRTKGKLQNNSASNNIKHLFRIINVAIINKWITSNPFKGFVCHYVNPVRHFLTLQDIDNLYSKKFVIERLEMVRDAFIFQIYTGLAFTDMEHLTPANIEIINGKQWIVIYRKKTGGRSAIPILPRAKAILDKYNGLLPVNSNQKMNAYLKEVGDLCGLTKPLTTHLGRHTFATTICLSNGVPIESISKMLGHTKITVTQIYAKVTDDKVCRDTEHLFSSCPA
jgi:site-specific recombinase XerD